MKKSLEVNKIYEGDSLDLIKEIPEETIDLVIADPPYGINKDFGNGKKWSLDKRRKWIAWTQQWLDESKRILKPKGSIFVYGIHRNIGFIQTYLYEIGMKYGRMFIWHYENGWSRYTRAPVATYEPILWFFKKEYTYHQIREPYKSQERLKYKVTKNGKTWKPNPKGRHGGDVWKIPTLAGKRFEKERVDHPTQKPLALCSKIVKHFSNPGDLIVVPFAGSGSECVSAKKLERDFIGFELNKDYIKIANRRLKKINQENN